MGLDVAFWAGQAEDKKKVGFQLPVAEYFKRVCAVYFERYVVGCTDIVKTDLWNESVAVERDMLGFFSKKDRLFGVDLSGVQCKGAYCNSKREIGVVQADVRFLPFRDGVFGGLLDVSTIDHVDNMDALRVVDEYRRVLRQGGVLFLLFAQCGPFALWYWPSFEGAFLLDAEGLFRRVCGGFSVVCDVGVDFLHSLLGLPPYRFLDRFLVFHCPGWFRRVVFSGLFVLELSGLSRWFRRFAGLRLFVGVKKR